MLVKWWTQLQTNCDYEMISMVLTQKAPIVRAAMVREIDFTSACGAIFTLVYTFEDFIGATTPSLFHISISSVGALLVQFHSPLLTINIFWLTCVRHFCLWSKG